MSQFDDWTDEQVVLGLSTSQTQLNQLMEMMGNLRQPKPDISKPPNSDGSLPQTGLSGTEMKQQAEQTLGFTQDAKQAEIRAYEEELARRQTMPASVASIGPLWLHRGACQKVTWLKK